MQTPTPAVFEDLDNAGWIDALRDRQPGAIAALRLRLCAGLRRAFVDRDARLDAEVEDFAQEAALRVLARLDAFRGDSRFLTWAQAIANRVALTELRRRRWRGVTKLPDVDGGAAELVNDSGGVCGSVRSELFATLHRAILSELTERQRTVLLWELDGVPQVVIAERCGVTANAVYKITHDARKKLRGVLERAGYDEASVRALIAHGE